MTYKELFCFSLAACLLCVDITADGLPLHSLSAPLVTAFLISWPTRFLPSRIRSFFQIALGECLMVLCLIDCYCQVYLGAPIDPQIFSMIVQTNHREVEEFFSVFLDYQVLLQWRIACILLLALLFPFSFLVRRFPLFRRNDGKMWKLAGGVLLALCLVYEVPPTYRYLQLFMNRADVQKMEGLIFRHYHEEVPTPIHRLGFAYYASRQTTYVLEGMKRSTFEANIDSCSYQSPHIVLVIGESYNKHHASLCGYRQETTPLQQRRMENGELFLFNDAVTPWNITSNAFISLFSLWENGCDKPIAEYPLFPALFRRAGYEVSFFSNQYLLRGFRKGATNQAGHFFLADAELSNALFCYRNRKSRPFDMELVRQVADYKKGQSEQAYTLDIVHLVGQHFDYSKRYPQSLAEFSLKDYADRALDKEAKEIVMHYDNATRYNDLVLDNLLSLYEGEEVVVLYVSDHGEEVYDELPLHGRLFQEPTMIQARNEFEVPVWIWCSESYQAKRQKVVDAIKAAQDKPFITERLPHLLLSLAGIACQWSTDSQDVLSSQYRCGARIISGDTDYDSLEKN